ncbi:unnamed protein product [Spirodela intermedia]|uniref:Fe2OG dioxygenase domain-containing protein n=1 Tax=Spirodela intermedia TaxID=51605 RepID=A0A7I8K2X2_SPIIN|nr:unnamed protein product [Spirodela intermedia]
MGDLFVREYDASELKIAAEFLTNWLPFLTKDLCEGCTASMRDRIRSLDPEGAVEHSGDEGAYADHSETRPFSPTSVDNREVSGPTDPAPPSSPKVRMSWADMAQEDELEMEAEAEDVKAQAADDADEVNKDEGAVDKLTAKSVVTEDKEKKTELSREQREYIRFTNVMRKKDFICLERVREKITNVLEGLELHTGVFSAAEQKRIVDFVHELQEKGRRGQLGECAYSGPEKWMRVKGRATIQFGCCYNNAMDKDGNPPGILRNVAAEPIPSLFKVIIRRLVRWHVLPPSCIPDSCIVNIYDPGDYIPPHIDNHDFLRPFCTVSFVSECNILFGSNLKNLGAGNFTGSATISLPVGSVIVLNGNGADIAKHCVPGVPHKRISITFRRIDEAKRPFSFQPEPDLQAIQPLSYDTNASKKKPSRRSIGVADAAAHPPRAEHGAQDRRAPPRDREAGRGRKKPSRVVIDGRSLADGDAPPPPSDSSGILPLPPGCADEPARRAARSAGRTVVVEQQRIVVRRNLDGDEEFPSPSIFAPSENPGGGDSRFSGSRPANRRRRRIGHVTHGVD